MDAISINRPSLRIQKSRFLYPLLAVLFLLSNIPFITAGSTIQLSTNSESLTSLQQNPSALLSAGPGTGNNSSYSALSYGEECETPHPGIMLVKTTNGFDGLLIPVGDEITWRYKVINIGDVELNNILVTDATLIEGSEIVNEMPVVIGTIAALPVGESATLTKTGTATTGMYKNVGAATFTYGIPVPIPFTVFDFSSYYGTDPGITIDKTTNGADGLYIPVGDNITWSYTVTNSGSLFLFDIKVTDSKLGDVGTIPVLAPGETSDPLTLTGTSVAGAYSNTGTAVGSYFLPVFNGDLGEMQDFRCPDKSFDLHSFTIPEFDFECPIQSVSDTDDSSYYGSLPGISINKTTNGADGLTILAGDPVTWSYAVTNTGNVTLTNIRVTDSDLGDIGIIASLAAGASQTLTKAGTAVADAYSNTGTAIGTPPVGADVSSSDDSNYFGTDPGISIDKTTNGADGLTILAGDPVTWSYAVTNTGNVTLTNIRVTDSDLGDIGTIASLTAGASQTLTKTGTAVADAYSNTGTAIGTPPTGADVSSSDNSSYYGADPSISIDKTTNGADGLTLAVGTSITWTYVVKNTGNVDLTNIVVTDSDLGAVGTIPLIAPDEAVTLTMTGTAAAGAYTNTGVATGTPVAGENTVIGPDVTDSDDSNYFGTTTALTLVKTVKNVTTGSALGKTATGTAGDDFQFSLSVTNTGASDLTNVTVTDSKAVVGSNVTVAGTLTQWSAGTDGIATLTIAALPAGQSVIITYVYDTAATDPAMTLTNSATVSSSDLSFTDTASFSITAVLGATRTPTPAPTVTTAGGSGVLGAQKTGEISNMFEIILGVTLLIGAIGLLSFFEIRKHRKDDINK